MSEDSLLPPRLFSPYRDERLKEAQALAARAGKDLDQVIALVTECTGLLKLEDQWIKRQGACEALIFLGPALNAHVECLKEKARRARRAADRDEELRVTQLAQVAWNALSAAVIGLIDRVVADRGIAVPAVAARALGTIGVPAKRAIEALETTARPSDEYTRCAAEALQQLRAAAAQRRNGD